MNAIMLAIQDRIIDGTDTESDKDWESTADAMHRSVMIEAWTRLGKDTRTDCELVGDK